MTEAEWLAMVNPGTPAGYRELRKFIDYAEKQDWKRKLRLFACGCTRHFWHLLPEGAARDAVVVTERWVDHEASRREWRTAYKLAKQAFRANCEATARKPEETEAIRLAMWAASDRLSAACSQTGFPVEPLRDNSNYEYQARVFRDLFGNPFRPVTADPLWLTSTVVALASEMYESRDFRPMPILADALQDAGCDNDNILNHCRGPGPHVRGCWVVDAVLRKE